MSNHRKYKAFAVDLDGTLLNRNHKISEVDAEALIKMREKGVKLITVTGRSLEETHAFNSYLNQNGDWAIFQGGSQIIQFKDDQLIEDFAEIDIADRRILYQIAEKNGFYPLCVIGNEVYSKGSLNEYLDYFETMMDEKIIFTDELKTLQERGPVGKISLLVNPKILDRAEVEMVKAGLRTPWGRSHIFGTDICARNKRQALITVLKQMGIDREELIAVGDSDNDEEMITYAGLGVAMGNATENMKQKADYITLDNDHGGITQVIERYILNT
ncbi:MAG: Cof-type HAD-IIB family hydrolase [Hespellia sp.]|nr:Cof-type HAD-IIB family hydrolase [Hespellia sp.]